MADAPPIVFIVRYVILVVEVMALNLTFSDMAHV